MLRDSKKIGTDSVRGTLYSLGAYPALSEEGSDEHELELYEVAKEIYQDVKDMELGAGYCEKRMPFIIDGERVEANVYFADEELESYCKTNCNVIQSY